MGRDQLNGVISVPILPFQGTSYKEVGESTESEHVRDKRGTES